MTFNFRQNKLRLITAKRMAEKKDIHDTWIKEGGFSKMEDKLKEKYRRDIDAGSLPF